MVGVFLCLHLYRYFTTNLPLDGRVVHLAVAGVLKRVLKTSSQRASSVPASTSMRVSKKEVQEFSYVVRRRPKLLPLEISNFLILAFKGQQPFSRKASFQDFLVGRKPIWRSWHRESSPVFLLLLPTSKAAGLQWSCCWARPQGKARGSYFAAPS